MTNLFGKRVRVSFDLPNGLDSIPLAYKCGWFEGIVTRGWFEGIVTTEEHITVTRDDGSCEHFRRARGQWEFYDGRLDGVPVSIIPSERLLPIVSGERDLGKLWKRRVVVTFDAPTNPALANTNNGALRSGRVEGVVVRVALPCNDICVGVETSLWLTTKSAKGSGVPVLNGHFLNANVYGLCAHLSSFLGFLDITSFGVVEERVLLLLDKKFGHLVCRDALGVVMAFLC